ncbi:MAG TPA: hypothetical protein VND93_02050 [Myxococcales bacterium]|nr:hypothetical protein [Myxococcales bacterium]
MPKSNQVSRSVAAAGLLAAFAQLGVAQTARAGEQAPQPQSQEQQVQPGQQTSGQDSDLVDLMIQFYDRLFDSQNN